MLCRERDKNKCKKQKADASIKAAPNEALPPARWEVEFVVAYFSRQTCRDASHVVADIARFVGLVKGTASEEDRLGKVKDELDDKPIKKRLEPFLDPILPRRTIRVNIADIECQTLGPSSSSGISSALHQLHFDAPPGTQLTTIADSDWPPCWSIPGHTVLAEPTGWGVISDIDDTIKITGTLSPVEMLKTTFIDPATPVAGMPELYAQLRQVLFGGIHTVRVSESFSSPEMATDLMEHDLKKLNVLHQRGKTSFGHQEAAIKTLLS